MKKDTWFFSHDYNARNDTKLQKVLMELGHEGKSVFWDLVEMLYENEGYLFLSEIRSYSFAIRTNEECITKLITEYNLFQKDGEKFWSDSILRRLNKRFEKSEKARASVQSRWNKSEENTNAIRTYYESNTSKVKESKIKESKIDNKESIKEKDFLKFWNLYNKKILPKKCKAKFMKLPEKDIEKIFEILPEYIKSTPDITFRKHPMTFLNNECWNDEIIFKNNGKSNNLSLEELTGIDYTQYFKDKK